jgi:hypothetical protein
MIFVILFSCLSRDPDDQGLSCGPGSPSIGKACRTAASKRLKQEKKKDKASQARCGYRRREGKEAMFNDERRLPLVTGTADVSSERA